LRINRGWGEERKVQGGGEGRKKGRQWSNFIWKIPGYYVISLVKQRSFSHGGGPEKGKRGRIIGKKGSDGGNKIISEMIVT